MVDFVDRDRFFKKARELPFGGRLNQEQVDGLNALIECWEGRSDMSDKRWFAYMLATAFWETARTMQPIEEYGHGVGREYGRVDPETGKIYYGRGYVQLTWKSNYEKMSQLTGVDLVRHPEKALDPSIASQIMFEGMRDGSFTGVGLGRYFNDHVDDPINARRIINGTDRASEIAAIYKEFLAAL